MGLAMGLFKAQNPTLIGLLIVIALGLPFLGYWIHQWLQRSVAVLSAVVAEVVTFIAGLTAMLSNAARYVKDKLEKVEAAKRKVDQALADRRKVPTVEETKLQEEIAGLKASEEQVASRLRIATKKAIGLEQQIATLNESRSLVRFLAERTKSDDYRKHLGVISTSAARI